MLKHYNIAITQMITGACMHGVVNTLVEYMHMRYGPHTTGANGMHIALLSQCIVLAMYIHVHNSSAIQDYCPPLPHLEPGHAPQVEHGPPS